MIVHKDNDLKLKANVIMGELYSIRLRLLCKQYLHDKYVIVAYNKYNQLRIVIESADFLDERLKLVDKNQ